MVYLATDGDRSAAAEAGSLNQGKTMLCPYPKEAEAILSAWRLLRPEKDDEAYMFLWPRKEVKVTYARRPRKVADAIYTGRPREEADATYTSRPCKNTM